MIKDLLPKILRLGSSDLLKGFFAGSADNEDKNAITEQTLTPFRQAYNGKIIAAGGFVKETAEQEIEAGNTDLIAMGTFFPCNLASISEA